MWEPKTVKHLDPDDTMEEANPHFLVKALQSYKGKGKGELSFKKDEVIEVSFVNNGEMQYFGTLDGRSGTFPYFYVKATGIAVDKVSLLNSLSLSLLNSLSLSPSLLTSLSLSLDLCSRMNDESRRFRPR